MYHLLSKCYDILIKEPLNVEQDDDTILENIRYELFEPRENGSREIGSANILELGMYLRSIYDKDFTLPMLEAMVEKKIIRVKPEEQRKEIRMVD